LSVLSKQFKYSNKCGSGYSLNLFLKSNARSLIFIVLEENKITRFSFGDRPVADMMGRNEPGEYNCAVSAAWVDNNTFSVMAQVIDTYFGCLNVHIGFKDSRATLLFKKSGQYVFDGIEGYLIAFADEEEQVWKEKK